MYNAIDEARDEKYEQAVGLLVLSGKGSTSFLQRKLGLGYNAAARLMERAQSEGIVAPPNHVGKREVLLRPGCAAKIEAKPDQITAAAQTMLSQWDSWFGGDAFADKEAADRLLVATCFAASAFEKAASAGITYDAAPSRLLRAFALALIDPMHPDLDYLRACNQPVAEPTGIGIDHASGPDQTAVTLINPPAAWLDVLAERQRQISGEGWTPEHDDQHDKGQMAAAAACYAMPGRAALLALDAFWPWDAQWWKPTDRRRDLIKAAALAIAEIERLDRIRAALECGDA